MAQDGAVALILAGLFQRELSTLPGRKIDSVSF